MKQNRKNPRKARKYARPQIKPHGRISEVASAFKP